MTPPIAEPRRHKSCLRDSKFGGEGLKGCHALNLRGDVPLVMVIFPPNVFTNAFSCRVYPRHFARVVSGGGLKFKKCELRGLKSHRGHLYNICREFAGDHGFGELTMRVLIEAAESHINALALTRETTALAWHLHIAETQVG